MAFVYSKHTSSCCMALWPWQLLLLLAPVITFSQQYNFTNYSVEQGLVQSQAQDIMQDKQGFIWIASLGGVSRFDGYAFQHYGKKDGLLSLLTFRIATGSKNNTWFGTQDGIQSYNGSAFETLLLPASIKSTSIRDINENKEGQLYLRSFAGQLFTVVNNHTVTPVADFANDFTSNIATDKQGNLYAAVYKRGIYQLLKNKWQQVPGILENDTAVLIKKIFFDHAGKVWLLTNKGVYNNCRGALALVIPQKQIGPSLTCIEEDARGSIWIGTTKGCYTIANDEHTYVGAAAGLTDNTLYKIMKDREGNLWFATDGDGIYKLSANPVSYLNNTHGLKGNVVMGITSDGNKTWAGTAEAGLQLYDGHSFTTITIPAAKPESQKTNSLLLSSTGQLWIGTLGGGLWMLKNGAYSEIFTATGNAFKEVISIFEDSQKTIWVCTGSGVFYFNDEAMQKIAGINHPCFSVIETGRDSMLVGSVRGLWQVTGKKNVLPVVVPGMQSGTVNCFAHWKNYLLLGTEDQGIIAWNPANGKTWRCSSANGLPGDFIFSLYCDSANNIFAGTGHGISKIQTGATDTSFIVTNYSSSSHPFGPECNLNAVQSFKDGHIWFGTTRGILVYNPGDTVTTRAAPLIYLTHVTLVSKNTQAATATDLLASGNGLQNGVTLPYNNNHLSFDFTGLYFTNPGVLQYRYMLEGADASYSPLSAARKVVYADLPPGRYRFKAYAVTDEKIISANSIDFAFTISAPFYQRTWFTVLSVLMLIAAGILLQRMHNRWQVKRRQAIAAIRFEEQQKIQERTAEDLHDDLGNKITRIAVLADLLQRKLDQSDTEKQQLVGQIKENTQSLYLGTKDIIMALAPGNDNLFELFDRCSSFGTALFEHSHVVFHTKGLQENYKRIKVSFTFSRNLLMVIKEAMNNILKHAGATNALLSVVLNESGYLSVLLSDNGKGFDDKNITAGHGLTNMKKRIERIGGTITIEPNHPAGTTIKIFFQLNA